MLYRLKKKYGNSVSEMLAYLEKCRAELSEIEYSSGHHRQAGAAEGGRPGQGQTPGRALSARRREAAEALRSASSPSCASWTCPRSAFRWTFPPKGGEFGMDETGMDEVQFLMSANVGEDLKPIQRIASGGELSRIMLALKNVLAENEAVATLIFDEVDTGVSGRAAQKVAEKMADVAGHKQVLCVTHLPQIAAMADTHFSVVKGERKGRTYTEVELLTRTRRTEELARLTRDGKIVVIATQVMLEGSDAEVYEVGFKAVNEYNVLQAYDMTVEAAAVKLMWILGMTRDFARVRELFYRPVSHDIVSMEE